MFFATLVPLFLLCITLASLVHALDVDLVSQGCKFELAGREYDFCPLLIDAPTRKITDERQTAGSDTTVAYELHFAGRDAVDDRWKQPESGQCPEATWICMTARARGPHQIYPGVSIARSSGTQLGFSMAGSFAVASLTGVGSPDAPLILHLGTDNTRSRLSGAHIRIYCDPTVHEPSSPTFSGEHNDIHFFTWNTKYGCSQPVSGAPRRQSPSLLTLLESDVSDSENENENENESEGEEDLVDPPPFSGSRHSTGTILFLSGSGIAILGLVIYSTPLAPMRRFVDTYVKPMQLKSLARGDEGRLVRWAQEDMGVLAGEEDMMVNGDIGEDEEVTDEYIPLKPSPRKGFVMPNYGSMTGRGWAW